MEHTSTRPLVVAENRKCTSEDRLTSTITDAVGRHDSCNSDTRLLTDEKGRRDAHGRLLRDAASIQGLGIQGGLCRARQRRAAWLCRSASSHGQRASRSSRVSSKLRPTAVLWVSWPKKSAKVPTDITEDTIRELALPLGFVDVKVCAVTDVWSGLKLVVQEGTSVKISLIDPPVGACPCVGISRLSRILRRRRPKTRSRASALQFVRKLSGTDSSVARERSRVQPRHRRSDRGRASTDPFTDNQCAAAESGARSSKGPRACARAVRR